MLYLLMYQGFASDDTFVDSFTLVGNDLTLGLNDGVSYTVDVTTLGVDENNFVASGLVKWLRFNSYYGRCHNSSYRCF